MNERNAEDFRKLLEATLSGLRGEKVKADRDVLVIWWQALADFSFEEVRAAMTKHVQLSVNIPRPADIIKLITVSDGRPSADEAWPIALRAADEQATVSWTHEIEQAWFHCLPVYQIGDEVGARMAFRKHYERIIAEARAANIPPDWHLTLGHDSDDRHRVVEEARIQGQISNDQALRLAAPSEVTGDGQYVTALLGYDSKPKDPPSDKTKRELKKIRKLLASPSGNRVEAELRRDIDEQKRRDELAAQEEEFLQQRVGEGSK